MAFNNHDPLYQQIYIQLKERIYNGTYPLKKTIPTEKNLIQEFKVSRITVQKAVRLLVDEKLVKRKPGVGTFVINTGEEKHRQKRAIGLIIPGLLQSFGEKMLNAIVSESSKRGYYLILKISKEDQNIEEICTNELLSFPVAGLLVNPVQRKFYNPILIKNIYRNFPIVVIDKELAGIDSMLVSSNHYQDALNVVKFLLRLGQKRIVILTYRNISNSTLERRINAFKQSFIQNSLVFSKQNIARIVESNYLSVNSSSTVQADVQSIQNYIVTTQPTCLVALDSHLAALAKQALDKLQMKVPQDISFFGFDAPDTIESNVTYTHLVQDEEQLGRLSVNLLIDAIEAKQPQKRINLISSKIIQKGTVKNLVQADKKA